MGGNSDDRLNYKARGAVAALSLSEITNKQSDQRKAGEPLLLGILSAFICHYHWDTAANI